MDIKIWYWRNANAGDYFTNYLIYRLGDTPIFSGDPDIIGAGSILQRQKLKEKKNVFIFGSGLHNEDNIPFTNNPDMYLAVRGKLTRERLNLTQEKKIILGDPGLLAGEIFNKKTLKKYRFGVVSHFVDYNDFKNVFPSNIPIINAGMQNESISNIEEVLEAISQCEFIFSSSLHGLIFAHSLRIPAIHLEHNPLISKGNFKFKDYYSVLDIPYTKIVLKKDIDKTLEDIKICTDKKELFLPSESLIKNINGDLLKTYELWKHNLHNR